MQGAVEKLAQPKDIFQALYNHFLRLADSVDRQQSSAGASAAAGASALAAFVEGDAESNRLLCARAMAAVYEKHAGAVGVRAKS